PAMAFRSSQYRRSPFAVPRSRFGPALGGLLVQLLGASFVFLVNAACFLFVILAIKPWKRDRAIPGCRGAGWSWMDSGCFGTLGGGPTRYAGLGARSLECRGYHGFAGSHGPWRGDLGLRSHEGWTEFYIAWRGLPIPD